MQKMQRAKSHFYHFEAFLELYKKKIIYLKMYLRSSHLNINSTHIHSYLLIFSTLKTLKTKSSSESNHNIHT